MSPECFQIVKTSNTVQRLLLVTSNSAHESDFLAALQRATSQRPDLQFELTYLDLSPTLDFFAIFSSLDRLRSGSFAGVYIAPQASTWSRVRHSSVPGQPPLRSRQHPLGFQELHPEAQDKTLQANAESEVCCWFLAQAAHCPARYVYVLFVFPEDLGGNAESGPSSLWDFLEVRVNDIQRGAAFLCQLAGSKHRRPMGLYSNLSSLQACMHRGWPSLFHLGPDLRYDGPLPPSCPCTPAHVPLKGVDSSEEFHSSSSSALGEQFWWFSVVPFLEPENASLRVGESAQAAYSGSCISAKSPWFPVRAPLPSFSSASSSPHRLFTFWQSGELTRLLFTDYAGADSAALYFSSSTPATVSGCTQLRTTTVGIPSSPSTSSGSTGSSKTPLVTLSPRDMAGRMAGRLVVLQHTLLDHRRLLRVQAERGLGTTGHPTVNSWVCFFVEVGRCHFNKPCGQGVLVLSDRTSGNSGLWVWTSLDLALYSRRADDRGRTTTIRARWLLVRRPLLVRMAPSFLVASMVQVVVLLL